MFLLTSEQDIERSHLYNLVNIDEKSYIVDLLDNPLKLVPEQSPKVTAQHCIRDLCRVSCINVQPQKQNVNDQYEGVPEISEFTYRWMRPINFGQGTPIKKVYQLGKGVIE